MHATYNCFASLFIEKRSSTAIITENFSTFFNLRRYSKNYYTALLATALYFTHTVIYGTLGRNRTLFSKSVLLERTRNHHLLLAYLKMVPYGGIEPTTSQFVAECSIRYTNRAFKIGTSRGIRTLNLQSLNLTQLPVMLPRHLKLITSHRLPTTIRLYFLNRLMAFGFNKDILVKLVQAMGLEPT